MIVGYIDEHKDRFGIEPICAELTGLGITIAPSTYYEKKACPVTEAALEEAYLVNALVTLHDENWGVYGVRKLWRAARAAGFDVGRDQMARLMRIGGLRGAVRGRHTVVTTQRDDTAARHPDLVGRDWDAPTGVDQLWVADFSYVWTLAGFVYVAFIVDVYSRRVLGWRVSASTPNSCRTRYGRRCTPGAVTSSVGPQQDWCITRTPDRKVDSTGRRNTSTMKVFTDGDSGLEQEDERCT